MMTARRELLSQDAIVAKKAAEDEFTRTTHHEYWLIPVNAVIKTNRF